MLDVTWETDRQLRQLCVTLGRVNAKLSLGQAINRLATNGIDPRALRRHIDTLAEAGSLTVRDGWITMHNFGVGKGSEDSQALLEDHATNRRTKRAAQKRRAYAREKGTDPWSQWNDDFQKSAHALSATTTTIPTPLSVPDMPSAIGDILDDKTTVVLDCANSPENTGASEAGVLPDLPAPLGRVVNSTGMFNHAVDAFKPSMVSQPEILRHDVAKPTPCNEKRKACLETELKSESPTPPPTPTAPIGKGPDRESSAGKTADGRPILSAEELRRRLGSTFGIIEKLEKIPAREERPSTLIPNRRVPEPVSAPIRPPPGRPFANTLTPLKIPSMGPGAPITLSQAEHLLGQDHEMERLPPARVVAMGATYDQARLALSLTAEARQNGTIHQSPVGFFLKTIANLKNTS